MRAAAKFQKGKGPQEHHARGLWTNDGQERGICAWSRELHGTPKSKTPRSQFWSLNVEGEKTGRMIDSDWLTPRK